ncbi:MAG: hypothetical protein ACI8UO_001719 [Verrucomicrobiales bacterium]|jgi:hypothetical protein
MKTSKSLVILVVLSVQGITFSQDPTARTISEWNIGPIHSNSTQAELRDLFGPENMKLSTIWIAEGETVEGTGLFEDTEDVLDIVWTSDFRSGRFTPHLGEFAEVPGIIDITGKNWKTEQGIGVGSSYEAVEKANGAPFQLGNFETDEAGLVDSWNGGAFGDTLSMVLHEQQQLPEAEYGRYLKKGSRKGFFSNDPEIAKMKPIVAGMQLDWGSHVHGTPASELLWQINEKVYDDPQELGEEISKLKEPWVWHFRLTDPKKRKVRSKDASWESEVVFQAGDIACLQITHTAPDEVVRQNYASAVLLVQKVKGAERGFRVVDLILRDGGGYGFTLTESLEGITERPLLYLWDNLDSTRRTGKKRHQIYGIVDGPEGAAQFSPAVTFDSENWTFGRDEECEVRVNGDQLEVKVTHQWFEEPDREAVENTVTLPWVEESQTFDAMPLKGLVTGNGFPKSE